MAPIPRTFANDDVDGKEDLPGDGPCCDKMCTQCIQAECASQLMQWQAQRSKLSNDDLNEFIFKLLLVVLVGGRFARVGNAPLQFKLFGHAVRRNAFRK